MGTPTTQTSFDRACSLLDTALAGTMRQEIVTEASRSKDFRQALQRLRESMRANVWTAGGRQINLERIVQHYDSLTRNDGFHALHDWDGIADQVNENSIPVDVLNYLIEKRGGEQPDRTALAILLDYYFLHLLGLLSLRIWDDGNADDHLDRLDRLLAALQGPHGSGQQFSANAETLILIATSHYELQEWGYDKLLARVRTLDAAHRARIALGHASSMSSHLRFGFEATYGRDTVNMRNDNVADYPWLCFSLATLMREYSRLREGPVQGDARDHIVEALLNGLTPDPRAFLAAPPRSLSTCESERAEFSELFHRYRQELLDEFERYRPSDTSYSPISFFFNFSHNVLKGTIVDALLRGRPWILTLNDLLTALPREDAKAEAKVALARTLTGYARLNPNRIRGRLRPAIVYDPETGRQAFGIAMRKMREQA